MRVPQEDHIHSQTFNSENLEFVWRFENKQIVLGVKLKGIYIETGTIDSNGDYIGDQKYQYLASHIEDITYDITPTRIIHIINSNLILDPLFWPNDDYNFFSNGKDLVPLIEDVIEYLK